MVTEYIVPTELRKYIRFAATDMTPPWGLKLIFFDCKK